ncbi:BLUF domain-containing protein [Robiginitomaculum antarcticum]|uniref:BLUF domain-containing protein n=1 Tax=Robiginitomaculum antarcticum TaxID=437507 RepID=UPI000A027CD1|nr:BLUF domain-containing protein [Robiginitomaculum antarcticum]
MHHIVYASSSYKILPTEELNGILEIARRANSANKITGMLLYKDGNFLHVLEGEKSIILSCYNQIFDDPRHHGIITLLNEPITTRSFQDWSMAFISYDDLSKTEQTGFSDVIALVNNVDDETISNSQLIVRSYLKGLMMI